MATLVTCGSLIFKVQGLFSDASANTIVKWTDWLCYTVRTAWNVQICCSSVAVLCWFNTLFLVYEVQPELFIPNTISLQSIFQGGQFVPNPFLYKCFNDVRFRGKTLFLAFSSNSHVLKDSHHRNLFALELFIFC